MSAPPVRRQFAGLVLWLLLTFVAAALGAWVSLDAGSFYLQLQRPSWAPPGSVFSPVWTTLFLLMAIAAWLVWRVRGFADARIALLLYLVQLVFNVLWSWLFFGWHLGGPAFVDVIVLWCLILATLIAFWRISRLAGVLLVPYLLWVGFAVVLNYTVWQLNPRLL
ncbi:TspO/MBR family protein [Thiohalophilus sp.]|uniref:TspO/MBR family protein n=1 Tax=Thiohalophilus sp. TaxID=3028392 RepID=UPI002ACE01F6|nr:TspO/MBR family protein [Thiohalophilus sp.]MDZ7661829.1 TspO/MBR family protein [Thiohalophilus sp.]